MKEAYTSEIRAHKLPIETNMVDQYAKNEASKWSSE